MESAPYVVTGILGFLFGYVFDFASLRPLKGVKPALWLLHSVLIALSLITLCLSPDRLSLPVWPVVVGAAILVLSATFEIYSLFVNLPFKRTYIADAAQRSVIKTGSYALVRHPSVLWFFLMLIGLVLVSGSRPLLISAPLWMGLDVLWVILQERCVFPKTLDGYFEYQKETPMLIPTASSIRAFLGSFSEARCREDTDARGA